MTSKRLIMPAVLSVACIALVAAPLVSARHLSGNSWWNSQASVGTTNDAGIENCIRQSVPFQWNNATARRRLIVVDQHTLRACLRGLFGGSSMSSSSRSGSSTSSMSSMSASSSPSSGSSASSLSASSAPSTSSTSSASTPRSSASSLSASSQSSMAQVNVSIQNFAFQPQVIQVKKGTTVRWTQNDSVPHTVTRDGNTGPSSPLLTQGQTYSYTFGSTGLFPYHCGPHPDMRGLVVVTN